jgi:flagellar hook protein FlgE
MVSISDQIQEIYIGLLGRAAAISGLQYWEAEINQGIMTLEQLRANIVNEQPEYINGLGQLDRAQLVEALYVQLFSRHPEASGLDYWVSGGGATVNADQLVLALIAGASPADRETLDGKVAAAQEYTQTSGDGYQPQQAADAVASIGAAPTLVLVEDETPDAYLLLHENQMGSVLGTVSVQDIDSSEHVLSVDDERFEIVDGQLKLKDDQFIDADQEYLIELTLTAIDEDGLSVETEVPVLVENEEDHFDFLHGEQGSGLSFEVEHPWQLDSQPVNIGDINGDGKTDTAVVANLDVLRTTQTERVQLTVNLDASQAPPINLVFANTYSVDALEVTVGTVAARPALVDRINGVTVPGDLNIVSVISTDRLTFDASFNNAPAAQVVEHINQESQNNNYGLLAAGHTAVRLSALTTADGETYDISVREQAAAIPNNVQVTLQSPGGSVPSHLQQIVDAINYAGLSNLSAELDSVTNEITIVSDTGADILLAGMVGDVQPLTLGVDFLLRPLAPAATQVMVNTDYYVYSGELRIEVEDGVTVSDIAAGDDYWGGLTPVAGIDFNPDDPDTYHWTTSTTIFDSLGEAHQLSFYFAKNRTDPFSPQASANTWNLYVLIDGEDVGNPAQGGTHPTHAVFEIQFGSDGHLLSTSDHDLAITNWTPLGENGNSNGALGPDNQSTPPFDPIPTSSNFVIEISDSTQFSGQFTEYSVDQNGFPAGDALQSNTSEVYVLFGSEGTEVTSLSPEDLDGSNGFIIRQFEEDSNDTPLSPSNLFIANAGDVDGDGFSDLLIAPIESFNPFQPSATYDNQFYLIYGQDDGWHPALSLDDISDLGTEFSLSWLSDELWQLNAMGDVNGDGYDDIAASVDQQSYLIFGQENGLGEHMELSQLHSSEGVLFEHVSEPLRPAGDINNDGYDDIVAIDVLGVAHIIYGSEQFF